METMPEAILNSDFLYISQVFVYIEVYYSFIHGNYIILYLL